MIYDADYFENGIESGKSLFTNYRWIPDLTIPMAYEIIKITGLEEGDSVLDFGCAKGYLVKALRLLHIRAFGTDISEYALSKADSDVSKYLCQFNMGWANNQILGQAWKLIIAKDVLEHLDQIELDEVLKYFYRKTSQLLVMVPLGDGEKYLIPAYEADLTHVIRQPLGWWKRKMESVGFRVDARIQWGHLKDNWKSHPEGNGFLLGTK